MIYHKVKPIPTKQPLPMPIKPSQPPTSTVPTVPQPLILI